MKKNQIKNTETHIHWQLHVSCHQAVQLLTLTRMR